MPYPLDCESFLALSIIIRLKALFFGPLLVSGDSAATSYAKLRLFSMLYWESPWQPVTLSKQKNKEEGLGESKKIKFLILDLKKE